MDSAQGPVSTELEQARAAPEFGAHTPVSEKLLAVAIRAQNFTGSSGIAIALTEGQEMICRASWGTSAPEVGTRLSIEHSFTGLCVRAGEPLRCDDAQNDPRVNAEASRALGISAIAVAPVRRGLKVIGVIAAFSDTPNAFTDKHLLILSTLSEVIVELLDDPHPTQPLPGVFETAPDLARAAVVAQAPVASLVDKAVTTTMVASAPADTQNPPTFRQSAATVPDLPVVAASAATAEATPAPRAPQAAVPSFTAPAVTASPKKNGQHAKPYDRAPNRTEAVRGSEILPAAMDPGLPEKPLKVSARVASTGLAAAKSLRETSAAETLNFAGIEGSSGLRRRWLVAAAVLVSVGIFAIAGLRWRRASGTHLSPAAVTQSNQAPATTEGTKAPEVPPAEPQHSPFSPPPITAVSAPAKAKPPSHLPADVTVRHSTQPVVEAAGPVRRLRASGASSVAPASEAQAPQLALSAPELPSVLAKPMPAAVAAPVSRAVAAQVVHRVEPGYPEAARRLRLSGQVVVKASITKAGTVGNVRWVSGNNLFRDATVTAVKQWRYKPATLNNQPVESDLDIILHFNSPTNR